MLFKFNNIRDLDDARYAAAMMAEWIGFTVGQEDSLAAGKIQEIIGWCAGPKLVLEAAEGIDTNELESMLKVLPVNGLEVYDSDFFRLKSTLQSLPDFWIVKNGSNAEADRMVHTQNATNENYCIVEVNTAKRSATELAELGAWAISLNCFSGGSAGTKDYEPWSRFFEELDLYQ